MGRSPYNPLPTFAMPYHTNTLSDEDNVINSKDLKEFFDLIMAVIDYDMSFDQFKKLNSDERKALIRDIKITKVLK